MEEQDIVIALSEAIAKKPEWQLASATNFTLCRGEHLAIVGRNGAGKTLLVDMLTGRHPVFPDTIHYHFGADAHPLVSDNLRYIGFRDTYGGDNDRTYFLQQRWNQMEMSDETPTAGDKLEEAFRLAGGDTPKRRAMQEHIYELLGIKPLLDKPVILLSSGELRKLKLASSLFADPRVLLIDNPFIGLDAPTRTLLKQLMAAMAGQQRLQLVLVLSKSDEIPDFITHVVEVADQHVKPKVALTDYLAHRPPCPANVLSDQQAERIKELSRHHCSDKTVETGGTPATPSATAAEVIGMRQVSISYGKRTILDKLDWTVRWGERWALSGQNGSGKSTLLSLVCADNPQGYACDISLFGHRRGTGESIWDIKRHIGYVSPEMHRSYRQNLPAIRIVASGLKDSIGLYTVPTESERQLCRAWLDIFGIGHLTDRPFLTLSSGEQRVVLLARAFVKSPDLLILDEPLHGLDNWNRQLVRDIIETYCQNNEKTLVMVTHYADELPPCITHHLVLKRN